MANYGGYAQTGGGGYGQTNPYEQDGGRYNQDAGNPYAQQGGTPYAQQGGNPYAQQPATPQPSHGGGRTQQSGYDNTPQQGGYDSRPQQGGYDNRYGGRTQAPTTGGAAAYGGGNEMEMAPMNGQSAAVTSSQDPNWILGQCRKVDEGIDVIERNLDTLRYYHQRALDDPDVSQGSSNNRQLDALSSETMTQYRNLAGRIKEIKQLKESGNPRNRPQVGLVDRKLKKAINDYQQVDRDFRHKLAAQIERQYRIVRPDASEEEVREAVEGGNNNQVFSQALMTSNRRGQAQSALNAVQGRHEAIQKIERQMIELAQLFQDMEAAVVQQEPAVEIIDQKAEDTHMNISKGNEQLDQAVVKAAAARRKKWICLGICVLIVLIIAAVIAVAVAVTQKKS